MKTKFPFSADMSLLEKDVFSLLGKKRAQGAIKQEDESWVSSTENHYSRYSDEECTTIPRQIYSTQRERQLLQRVSDASGYSTLL